MGWWRPGWKLGAWVFGLTVYAGGLIATLPATLIDASLGQTTHSLIRLTEAQGTLWSGAGYLELRDKGQRIGHAHSMAWRFLPWSLLRGHLAFEVELDRATQKIPLTFGLWRIELTNADIRLPAAVLGMAVPKLAPLALGGDLSLHIASLDISRDSIQGNAVIQWQQASSALTAVSPLGNYQLDVNSNGATIHAALRTLQGPLQLDGKGSWAANGSPAFAGNASVPPPLQQQLAPLLRLIAVERNAGNFEIQLK